MADPKYDSLPGIDKNAPDVYETTDLPEDDQAQVIDYEDGNENIEKLNVDPSQAFNKFKDKTLDSSGIDFSDRVSQQQRTGYGVPQTEYEILGAVREKETPQQKYQRLQHEIRELSEDVSRIKESVSAENDENKVSPVQLAKQVEYLQHQLTDLHLDKLLGPNSQLNLADPHGALQKRLLTELDAYKPGGTPKGPGTEAAPVTGNGDTNHVTYQLYYRPEQAKFSNNARLADVEQRIERLEAVIGSNSEGLSTLTADTNNKSVVGAVAVLSGKVKLLDPSQIEHIEGRMHALGVKLTQISEKKDNIENTDKTSKISELYDLVKKWDAVVDTLPHVVDRLTALKELHEQALQFSQALTHLDTAQQQILTHVKAHGDMVKQVEQTLSDNMNTVKTNMESLDGRMKAIK